jgi:PDZ domain-containing secreted protein
MVLIVMSMIVPLIVVMAMRPVKETVLVPGEVRMVNVETDGVGSSGKGSINTVSVDERHPRYAEWLYLKRQPWYSTREQEDPILIAARKDQSLGFSMGPDVISVNTRAGVRLVPDIRSGRGQLQEVQKVAQYVGTQLAGQKASMEGDGVVIGDPHNPRLMGTVIVAANGQPVHSTFDLDRIVRRVGAGGTLHAQVSGSDYPLDLKIPDPKSIKAKSYGLSGMYMWTANQRVATQHLVYFANAGEMSAKIEGPSGGLSYTLAVYAALTKTDVVDGRKIVATGIVAPDGRVTPILGIAQKTVAARRAGADVFIVPQEEEARAKQFAGQMKIVGVVFAKEGAEYLQRTSRGRAK